MKCNKTITSRIEWSHDGHNADWDGGKINLDVDDYTGLTLAQLKSLVELVNRIIKDLSPKTKATPKKKRRA